MGAYPGLVLGASVPLLRCEQKGARKTECVLREPTGPVKRVWAEDGVEASLKRVRYVKILASKPDILSSIPGTCIVEGEDQLLKVVLSPLHVH